MDRYRVRAIKRWNDNLYIRTTFESVLAISFIVLSGVGCIDWCFRRLGILISVQENFKMFLTLAPLTFCYLWVNLWLLLSVQARTLDHLPPSRIGKFSH